MYRFFLIAATLVFLHFASDAQVMGPINTLRQLTIESTKLPIKLESNAINNSLIAHLMDSIRTEITDQLEIRNDTIFWKKEIKPNPNIYIHLSYRIYPPQFSKSFRLRDTNLIFSSWSPLRVNEIGNQEQPSILMDRAVMNYRGSFTRGITLGNNQSLALNSAFNLQMNGDLGDDIKITGVMSDNSIPIQPDGNSQQLQEFDKVFIVLSRKKSSLTVGDFEINRPNSYFINYFKKLQGAQINNETQLKNNHALKSSGGIAITKGKFNRQNITITEGNQGPYRLVGSEGETFVIILAGTERIYYDGVLLSRGFDRDYIIDYNSGELTFMPHRRITKDSRIVAEYEYSNQEYLRSFYQLNLDYVMPKWKFSINGYNEQDGKNSGIARDFSPEDKQTLIISGDSISRTFINAIRQIEPSNESIVVSYSLVDTLVEGQTFTILSFPWKQGTNRYVSEFADVGENNGFYTRSNDGVNGRVYKWISPDPVTGQLRGRYNPLTKLTSPIQKQMFSFNTTYTPDSLTSVFVETSVTGQDLNRYSSNHDADNYDLGYFISAKRDRLPIDKNQNWMISSGLSIEHIGKNFTTISPYRNPEFTRDWNLAPMLSGNQNILSAFINQNFKKKIDLNYKLAAMSIASFKGYKHDGGFRLQTNNTIFNAFTSYLKSNDTKEKSEFLRPDISFSQTIFKKANIKTGFTYLAEFNRRSAALSDSLLFSSNGFQVGRLFLSQTVLNKINSELFYQRRFDYLPFENDLKRANNAHEYGIKTNWKQSNNSSLILGLSIRDFEVNRNASNQNLTSKKTYLGQLDYLYNLFKNRFSGNTLFEISSGSEQKIEFYYLSVLPGTGEYAWLDFNSDSIQQVNEFTANSFPEQKNFVRVNILSNEYIPTLNSVLSQSLRWEGKQSGDQKFWNKWSTLTGFRLERKTNYLNGLTGYNPVSFNTNDTNLITYLENFRHSFIFNKGHSKYELQLNGLSNRTKNLLVTGNESRSLNEISFISRVNFTTTTGLIFSTFVRNKVALSESVSFRVNNYDINALEIKPEFNWIIDQKLRFATMYRLLNQQNQLSDLSEKSTSNEFSLKMDLNRNSFSSLRMSGTMAIIKYNGTTNSAVEFAMLEGLKNGKNFLWNLSYDHNLKNHVQISFIYDGRKSDSLKTVHTGRAQVKAFF